MLDGELTQIANLRQSELAKLTRFMRGDLDWIVMKCLEKNRNRRYETANALVMDIQPGDPSMTGAGEAKEHSTIEE